MSWGGGVNEELAKLRTGVGSAEMSHLKHCSLKIYLKRALGGDRGEGSGWCGVRVDVMGELKFLGKFTKKKYFFFWGGGRVGLGGGRVGLGGGG